MKFSGSSETLRLILEKWCLMRHGSLQSGSPKATYPVVLTSAAGFSTKQFPKLLCVYLKPTLNMPVFSVHEVFIFVFL